MINHYRDRKRGLERVIPEAPIEIPSHVMAQQFMGTAPFWRCEVCSYETADLSKVAYHVVTHQYAVSAH